jgi:hypothetical protein
MVFGLPRRSPFLCPSPSSRGVSGSSCLPRCWLSFTSCAFRFGRGCSGVFCVLLHGRESVGSHQTSSGCLLFEYEEVGYQVSGANGGGRTPFASSCVLGRRHRSLFSLGHLRLFGFWPRSLREIRVIRLCSLRDFGFRAVSCKLDIFREKKAADDLPRLIMRFTIPWPNKTPEPTADSRCGLSQEHQVHRIAVRRWLSFLR